MSSATAPDYQGLTLKCCGGGVKTCKWEAPAASEDFLLFQIERHALDQHNFVFDDEGGREKLRATINRVG